MNPEQWVIRNNLVDHYLNHFENGRYYTVICGWFSCSSVKRHRWWKFKTTNWHVWSSNEMHHLLFNNLKDCYDPPQKGKIFKYYINFQPNISRLHSQRKTSPTRNGSQRSKGPSPWIFKYWRSCTRERRGQPKTRESRQQLPTIKK